jgi:general secretion pathway protein G
MDSPSSHHPSCWQDDERGRRPAGFSLLEMMMVVTVILILAAISTPLYRTAVIRAREAVLREHLFTLRNLINEFTRDMGRAPLSLDEIVEKGYLKLLPTDPFTGSNETWQETKEDEPLSTSQKTLGIVDVHSGSEETSLEGTPYNSW